MNLSDKDFLTMQFLHLDTSYVGEMVYVKDCDNKFLYANKEFTKAFDVTTENIIGKDMSVIGIPKTVANTIIEQEKVLHKKSKPINSVYIHKHAKATISYLVRTRLLKNPYTKKVVGTLTNMEPFTPGYFRKVYLQIIKQTFNMPSKPEFKLNKLQNEIIFCLSMGFSTRKEIASVIGFFSGEHDEHKVKNALYGLYEIFECNSTSNLLNNVLLNDVEMTIPDGIVMPCSIVISK